MDTDTGWDTMTEFVAMMLPVVRPLADAALNTSEPLGLALWGGALVGLSVILRGRLAARTAAAAAMTE